MAGARLPDLLQDLRDAVQEEARERAQQAADAAEHVQRDNSHNIANGAALENVFRAFNDDCAAREVAFRREVTRSLDAQFAAHRAETHDAIRNLNEQVLRLMDPVVEQTPPPPPARRPSPILGEDDPGERLQVKKRTAGATSLNGARRFLSLATRQFIWRNDKRKRRNTRCANAGQNRDGLSICYMSQHAPNAAWLREMGLTRHIGSMARVLQRDWVDRTFECPQCEFKRANGSATDCFIFKDEENMRYFRPRPEL